MKQTECPDCGTPLNEGDQTCQKCGKALSFDPAEPGVHCRVCDTEIGAYAEKCPSCGETGYPALRPRKGKGFKGSPALEEGRE